MLQSLIEGAISPILTAFAFALNFLVSQTVLIFGMDLDVFNSFIPVAKNLFFYIQGAAAVLLVFIFAFQALKGMVRLDAQRSESGVSLLVKFAICAILIANTPSVMNESLKIARAPFNDIYAQASAEENKLHINFSDVQSNIQNSYDANKSANSGKSGFSDTVWLIGSEIVAFILLIGLSINYIRFLLVIVGKYALLGVSCYLSPLAFASGTSNATSSILKSYIGFAISTMLQVILNLWFLVMINSAANNIFNVSINGVGQPVFGVLLVIALLSLGTRLDTLLSSLGLTSPSTSSAMAMDSAVAGLAGTKAVSAIGSAIQGVGGAIGGLATKNSSFGKEHPIASGAIGGVVAGGAGLIGAALTNGGKGIGNSSGANGLNNLFGGSDKIHQGLSAALNNQEMSTVSSILDGAKGKTDGAGCMSTLDQVGLNTLNTMDSNGLASSVAGEFKAGGTSIGSLGSLSNTGFDSNGNFSSMLTMDNGQQVGIQTSSQAIEGSIPIIPAEGTNAETLMGNGERFMSFTGENAQSAISQLSTIPNSSFELNNGNITDPASVGFSGANLQALDNISQMQTSDGQQPLGVYAASWNGNEATLVNQALYPNSGVSSLATVDGPGGVNYSVVEGPLPNNFDYQTQSINSVPSQMEPLASMNYDSYGGGYGQQSSMNIPEQNIQQSSYDVGPSAPRVHGSIDSFGQNPSSNNTTSDRPQTYGSIDDLNKKG